MGWETIGPIGETTWAVTLLATLAYIAAQTSSRRTTVKSGGTRSTAEPFYRWRSAFVQSPIYTIVILAGCAQSPLNGDSHAETSSSHLNLHYDSLVVDGHNDVGSWILDFGFDLGMDGADPDNRAAELYWFLGGLLPKIAGDKLRTHTDLDRLRRGGVDAQFFSIFAHPRYDKTPGGSTKRAHAMIDALEEQIERHANHMESAVSSKEVRRIAGEGKIAVLLGLEGGHSIGDDLDKLREFRARGICYMTLTWSNTNNWADSSSDKPKHGGLTSFGREVVQEMNRLGMVVDVSHSSDETFWDVLEVTQAPIMASHSAVRALVDIPRNLSDDMLRAIANNGGIVMINFGGTSIDPRKASVWKMLRDAVAHLGTSAVSLDLLLDHIDHAVATAGIDHVGLGSDFDGTMFLPVGLRDVSGYPNITKGLLARGYPAEDVRKILGENILRVLEHAQSASGTAGH